MAGVQNAVAVLILVSQLPAMLGIPRQVPLPSLLTDPSPVQLPTLLVGILTCLAIWLGPRAVPVIPPILLGLIVGTGAYFGLAGLGLRAGLGPVVGTIPSALPQPSQLTGFVAVLTDRHLRSVMPTVLLAAATLALIASLDALLCAKTVESVTGLRVRKHGHRLLRWHRGRSQPELDLRQPQGGRANAAVGGRGGGRPAADRAVPRARHRARAPGGDRGHSRGGIRPATGFGGVCRPSDGSSRRTSCTGRRWPSICWSSSWWPPSRSSTTWSPRSRSGWRSRYCSSSCG